MVSEPFGTKEPNYDTPWKNILEAYWKEFIRFFFSEMAKKRDFYKAMTSYANHRMWQDVYHGMTEDGIGVHIKICGLADGCPPVIQFKAK